MRKRDLILIGILFATAPALAAKKSNDEIGFREKQKLVRLVKQDDAVAGALRSAPQKICKMKQIKAKQLSGHSTQKIVDFDLTLACEDQSSETTINVTGIVFGKKVVNLVLTRQSEG